MITDRDAILVLIDALLRKGTEQDGNWGFPAFRTELESLRDKLYDDVEEEDDDD